MQRRKAVVVLAAGLGTRMRSAVIKVLHPIAGRPLIHAPIEQALALGAVRIVVVLGHQREAVEAELRRAFPDAPLVFAHQAEQLGTAHAVGCAAPALDDFDGDVFVLAGDVPSLTASTLAALDERAGDAPVAVLGMRLDDPARYGRLIRGADDALTAITEHADCTPEQRQIREVNAGVYRFDARYLFATLNGLGRDNAQGEYYLTDVVAAAAQAGLGVADLVLEGDAALDAEGVNDRADLSRAEARAQRRLRARLMAEGVTLIDPERVWLHEGVAVGPDTVIEPGVSLLGETRIGRDCVIEQGARLQDTVVGDGVHIAAYTVAGGAVVEAGCVVGPLARLREGAVLRERARVGNFVELKKTEMGPGAKANHLAYLGDATVGAGANVGAGTITCNYDGRQKLPTRIGAGAFIGSDTQLVAPVTVGDGAYVAAGTTVTADVPPGALVISRVRQKIVTDWVARRDKRPSSAPASVAPPPVDPPPPREG